MVDLPRWRPASCGSRCGCRAEAMEAARLTSGRSRAGRRSLGDAGNVAVEFALALPVLMLLMLGSAEMARFVILHQKVDRVATTTSDLVARAETIKEIRAGRHL